MSGVLEESRYTKLHINTPEGKEIIVEIPPDKYATVSIEQPRDDDDKSKKFEFYMEIYGGRPEEEV